MWKVVFPLCIDTTVSSTASSWDFFLKVNFSLNPHTHKNAKNKNLIHEIVLLKLLNS